MVSSRNQDTLVAGANVCSLYTVLVCVCVPIRDGGPEINFPPRNLFIRLIMSIIRPVGRMSQCFPLLPSGAERSTNMYKHKHTRTHHFMNPSVGNHD